MCFKISGFPAPKNKTAWKVVRVDGSGMWSRTYPERPWQRGVTNRATGRRVRRPGRSSKGGVYVYLTRRSAINHKVGDMKDRLVLLRVKVSPDEFIACDAFRTVATYQTATPTRRQLWKWNADGTRPDPAP
jgi:hypothetical protein